MAARGLVNGRGPLRSSGRDSAKHVVFTSITLFSGVLIIILTNIYNGDAVTAKLDVLVVVVLDGGNSV